jgi:hypothetical protein
VASGEWVGQRCFRGKVVSGTKASLKGHKGKEIKRFTFIICILYIQLINDIFLEQSPSYIVLELVIF